MITALPKGKVLAGGVPRDLSLIIIFKLPQPKPGKNFFIYNILFLLRFTQYEAQEPLKVKNYWVKLLSGRKMSK